MTYEEMIDKAISYFEENEGDFICAMDDLDSWCGYLGDDRYYPMSDIDDHFCDVKVSDFLDRLSGDFNHNDNYFKYGVYGLESSNEVDYSDYLDRYAIQAMYENAHRINLPEEIRELFEEYDTQEEEDVED